MEKVNSGAVDNWTYRWGLAVKAALNALDELEELQTNFYEWNQEVENEKPCPACGKPEHEEVSKAFKEKMKSLIDLDFGTAREVIVEADDTDKPLGFGRDD